MGKILLVRHGQASFGADDYDALSPLGFEQSRLLGTSLAARGITAEVIVRGTMRRHRETAETCAGAAGWETGPTVVDPGWDEFDFLSVLAAFQSPEIGTLPRDAQADKAEFQRLFELATEAWVSGADHDYPETYAQFTGRVHEALARTVDLAVSGTVAVFTSGGPLARAVSELLVEGGSGDLWRRLNRVSVNSGLTRLITSSRGTNLLSFNDQAHLDGVPGALSYR